MKKELSPNLSQCTGYFSVLFTVLSEKGVLILWLLNTVLVWAIEKLKGGIFGKQSSLVKYMMT